LAKKDGNWLQYDDKDVSQLKKKDVPMDARNKYGKQELKMEPTFLLKKYFSGTNIPKDKAYHGLVVVPERKDQDVLHSNIWAVKPEIMDLMKRYIDVQVNERIIKKQKRMEIIENPMPLINVDSEFVTLPKIYLENAGLVKKNDVVLYCRPIVRLQIQFLKERVMAKNVRGIIVGPSGTGKSVCTLAFLASLNRDEWQVI
jgi:hypothetical protein